MNLGCIFPHRVDATSFYRGMGPIGILRKKIPNLELNIFENGSVDWAILRLSDVLFLQRPFINEHLGILLLAKEHGLRIWVDYDDDLFSLPRSNPARVIYDNPEHQSNIVQCLKNADVVSVSTQFLRKRYLGFNENIVVIPNALPDDICEFSYSSSRAKTILWRGGASHFGDLYRFKEAFARLSHDLGDWKFHFWGMDPWVVTEAMKEGSYFFSGGIDPCLKFLKAYKQQNAALCVVPLEDIKFNYSKSNIAFLEAIYAGAVTIAPDWEEWRVPGVIHYKDDFYSTVKGVCELVGSTDGLMEYSKLFKESREWLMENRLLSKVNELRRELLEGLFS